MLRIIFLVSLLWTLPACVTAPPSTTGSLGFEDSRRVVIVGENVDASIALYYQKKYAALVWFTPFQGKLAKNTSNFFQNGFGPSVAMKGLIRELKSINYTIGQWEIIVPGIAETYFYSSLKYMPTHSLSKARGIVVLIDSKQSKEIEQELKRVTNGSFFVSYEFQK